MTKRNNLLIFILALGVFSMINTEMGITGILPIVAENFNISISQAGSLVSLFALAASISGPTMPLLLSGINRKKIMLLGLGSFIVCNIVSMFAPNFTIALIARVIPGFLEPVYVSVALTIASTSVRKEEAQKAVSRVILGVSAGMILGVPVVTFIANATSFKIAMLFFAVANAIAFIATLIFVPSMPVKERLSYGAQLSILKKPITWISFAGVILISSGMFVLSSYFAVYLEDITNTSGQTLSVMLLVYGVASIIGNIMAGSALTKNAMKTVVSYPFILGAVYVLLFLMGKFTGPMVIIVAVVLGILYAIGNNICQYWVTSAAPEAPDFANGLYLSCGNLGITIGTAVGGLFISGMGIQYVVIGGILFLILSFIFILVRKHMHSPAK